MEEKTYDEILTAMETKFQEKGGFTPAADSDLGLRLRVVAGEVYNLQTGIQWLARQVFPQTAAGEFLERHAAQRGLTRGGKTTATGTLTFSREKALTYALTIPQGTVCALTSDPTVRFVTTEEAELAPLTFSVTVPAAGEDGGSQYNVAAGTVTQMVTPPLGIEAVTNTAFTGGGNAETDEQLRSRILQLFQNGSNGVNKGFYTTLAMGLDGVFSANTVVDDSGNVTVYVCGRDGAVSDGLLSQLQDILDDARPVNATVTAAKASEKSIDFACYVQPAAPYRLSDVADRCTAMIQTYIAALPIGGSFMVAQIMGQMMAAGLIENYKAYSYTTDVALAANQRAKLNSTLLTKMT